MMILEGTVPALPRSGFPSLATYLRTVIALGLGSLRLSFPALAFLYFYRLGMGLYLAFSRDGSSPFGTGNEEALIMSGAMHAAGYLPLLVLIYTPFLPLQDALLLGKRRSFPDSVRHVLERLVPFGLSVIAQLAILFGPPALLLGGMVLFIRAVPSTPQELLRVIALVTVAPCVLYVAIAGLFLMFAVPSVIIDGRGPLAAIRQSLALVGRNAGAIFGRLFVFFSLLLITAMAASLPEAFLQAGTAATGFEHPAIKITGAIWAAAVAALLFPFTVAALLVLYRSAVPSRGTAPASGETIGSVSPEKPLPATSPFIFE